LHTYDLISIGFAYAYIDLLLNINFTNSISLLKYVRLYLLYDIKLITYHCTRDYNDDLSLPLFTKQSPI